MTTPSRSRVFWSGGSQAVRLPKAMRLSAVEVTIERRGNGLLIVPRSESDDWDGFWDDLAKLAKPIKRWKTRAADKRKPL